MQDIAPILDLIGNVGTWIVFLVLFLRKDEELKQEIQSHMSDLRKANPIEDTRGQDAAH